MTNDITGQYGDEEADFITDDSDSDNSHIPLDDFSLDEFDDFDNLDSDEIMNTKENE